MFFFFNQKKFPKVKPKKIWLKFGFTKKQIEKFGFKKIGTNVKIAKNCTIVGLNNISLGNNIRIDSNVVIAANKGHLILGNYIHIGVGSYLNCEGGITLSNFSGLSQGVHIYSSSGDFSGKSLNHPTVPKKYQVVKLAPVFLKEHVIIGTGSVVLPGVTIGKGSSVGALSLVSVSLDEWGVYFGVPVRKINIRSKKILELEKNYIKKKI